MTPAHRPSSLALLLLAACAVAPPSATPPDRPGARGADAAVADAGELPSRAAEPGEVDPEPDAPQDAPDPGEDPEDRPAPPRTPSPLAPLSGGFVDHGSAVFASVPLRLDAGDPATFDLPGAVGALFADVDGDGTLEVVLASQLDGAAPGAELPRVQVFDWTDAGLVHDAAASAALQAYGAQVAAVVDLDGDGLVDLVLGPSWPSVVRGTGPGRFGEVENLPRPAGYDGVWSGWGVAPYDLDDDGLLDLVVGDRTCRAGAPPVHLVRQEAPWRFVDRTDAITDRRGATPWTVGVVPTLDGDPALVMLGSACDRVDPHPGFLEMTGRGPDGWPSFHGFDPTPAASAYKQLSVVAGGPISGLNPMGAALGDWDADGLLDLAVASDAQLVPILSGWGAWPMEDLSWQDGDRATYGPAMFSWSQAPVDVDLDGVPDLLVTHGDDPGSYLDQLFPSQHTLFLRSDGVGGFEELSAQVGLDVGGNWRSIAVADPDGDGDLDVLVGGYGQLPVALRNDVDAGHHGLTLELVGTQSPRAGVGAIVEVVDADLPPTVHLAGGVISSTVWTGPTIGLGLGDDPVLEAVRVTWPSGVVQEVRELAAGGLHRIVEPEVVRLVDAGSTGDARVVAVQVSPRALDGTLRAASVEVAVVSGPGTWAEGAGWADGVWERTLRVPDDAAEDTVLTMKIDGQPLRLHPRIRRAP